MSTAPPRTRQVVFVATLLFGLVAWYGGIRSPDSEVSFELCEALHDRRSLSVEGGSPYAGFGLARGRDGRQYSIFGLGQPLACVPMFRRQVPQSDSLVRN